MAAYPDPLVYARAVIANAMIDCDRTQNAQRGAGAKVVYGTDGVGRTGRTIVSGDAPTGEGMAPLFDLLVDAGDGVEDTVVTTLDAARTVAWILDAIRATDPLAAEAWWLVTAQGLTQDEAARLQGVARETVNRRVGRALKAAKRLTATARTLSSVC